MALFQVFVWHRTGDTPLPEPIATQFIEAYERPLTSMRYGMTHVRHVFAHNIVHIFMMTSSNGNIFRVTGHLCGEFTGPRWIPRTKASDAELWCFFICVWINGWVNNREAGDLRRYRAHCDVTVMCSPAADRQWNNSTSLSLCPTVIASGDASHNCHSLIHCVKCP